MRPQRTLRQRIIFVITGTLMVAILFGIAIPTALGARFISGLIAPGCGGGATPPMPYQDVSFPSSEFNNRPTPAYFIPADPPTGASVIVLPTGNAARGDRMDEIAVYHAAGLNVLTYSSRACLDVSAVTTLGYKEAIQVGDALTYLATRSDVDQHRIAIHGFSAGGAAAIMAAAQFPAIHAVVAEGGYHDFADEVDQNASNILWFAPFFRLGAKLDYRLTTGLDMSVLSPLSVISKIAPRPILLIYGSKEPSFNGAHLELAAAGSNATLWEVPGATHGSYIDTDPTDYKAKVTAFIMSALQ